VPTENECALISTTVSDERSASALADKAVESRLAACAQIAPIRSVYRWNGAVHRDQEFLIRFKTMPDRANDLIAMILDGHPYELPELIVERAAASPAYLEWVSAETRPGPGEKG
jgi:periplasmic divalent cation tolerance protein